MSPFHDYNTTRADAVTAPLKLPGTLAVLLPGTGSDEIFITSAFRGPLADIGVRLVAPAPDPGARLAHSYLGALDAAAEEAGGPILVGGVSFGAHLSAAWALRNPAKCAGMLAALPAWNGAPDGAPAALAARASAALVRAEGIERALDLATAAVAPWLAEELRRAWRRQGTGLADGLEAAALHPAPELTALSQLDVPVGIAACTDDAVHPAEVACAWAEALPCSRLVELTLEALGADRAALGRAAVLGFLRAVAACS